MKHIFISHAGPDKEIATKLCEELRNAGHETLVDTKELTLGKDSIDFMNDGIADANAILILYSSHTKNAPWQKLEINAAVWNENAQDGGLCIVLRLDDTRIPPILGPKVYGKLDVADRETYKTTIEEISKVILPQTTATTVVNRALNPETTNPFRRIRAEYFEDESALLSKAFAAPDASMTGQLESITPCYLEGSRGTGKSMLLMSLRSRVYAERKKDSNNPLAIFGFYIKLNRGAFCNIELNDDDDQSGESTPSQREVQVTDLYTQEFVICLLESLFSELHNAVIKASISVSELRLEAMVEEVSNLIFETPLHDRKLSTLLSKLAKLHRELATFARRKFVYEETSATTPIASLDFDAFAEIIRMLKRNIAPLADSMFVALLDEYENLPPFQQRVVNTFVKLAPPTYTVKIAKKLGTKDISKTSTGQELQEIHDYTRLHLVYDVDDGAGIRTYKEILKHIVSNILRSEGYTFSTIDHLLPEFQEAECDEDLILREVEKLCKLTKDEFASLPPETQTERITYYREASIYRVLYGRGGRSAMKRFAGFHNLTFVSSGVIRYFQEILSVAYFLEASGENESTSVQLTPAIQSKAVHLVSTHNLTTISRNVEKDGEALKYFLCDIGDCLRSKLLNHTSEPEAGRITIKDPEHLGSDGFRSLRRILNVGTREGVFQTKEGRPAFKPKHSNDPQPAEFNISRIFSPVLQTSPRLRWRTPFTCEQLQSLLTPATRSKAKTSMMKSVRPPANPRDEGGLFSAE